MQNVMNGVCLYISIELIIVSVSNRTLKMELAFWLAMRINLRK